MIAPDDTTFAYLKGRQHAPQGDDWDRAVESWRELRSDDDAEFDTVVHLDGSASRRSSRGVRTRVRACRCRRACRRVTGRPPSVTPIRRFAHHHQWVPECDQISW